MINGPRTQGTISAGLGVAADSSGSTGTFHFFPSLTGAIKHTFDPRLSLSLTDTFTRSDDPSLADPFGLRQERRTFTTNMLSLSADWLLDLIATQGYYRLSTFFSDTDTVTNVLGANASIPLGAVMTGKLGYEFSESTSSGQASLQSTGHLILGSLTRQFDPFRSIGVSASYSFQSNASTQIFNVSVFTAYNLPARLSLSGSLGYSLLTSDMGGPLSTVSSNTNLSYYFAQAVVTLGILQDFRQTFLEGQNFGVVETRSYTGSFFYPLTPFIDTTLRASYSENKSTGVGNSRTSPDTNIFTGEATLNWRLRPWLTTSLDYTFKRYGRGASAGGDATENRATVTVTASF